VASDPVPLPAPKRRIAAIASYLAVLCASLALVLLLLSDPLTMVAAAASLAFAVGGAWNALTRNGMARLASATLGLIGVLTCIVVLVVARDFLALFLGLGLALAAVALARYSLGRDRASLISAPTPGTPVAAATRPVLIMNLRAGGGKAEQFKLADECRRRGIEPVVLQPGDDLLELAEAAIDRGADVIGMAGGDGSQALVASVAARRGAAHVVVPAGTRNHFALDLGLDRNDVIGALDAFGPAVERRIDLAEVNGRVFVNNVSLGVYGEITQSEEYRDAKVATTLDQLPTLLGPRGQPMDLGWTGPDGVHHDSAHLIQVSNNRYSLRLGGGSGTRDRLDGGRLGILAVEVSGTGAAVELATLVALRRPDGARALEDWTADSFEVTSHAPIAAGVDGEALRLESPLQFRILPGALRVRLPTSAPGYAPAAIAGQSAAATLGNVWRVARGRPPHPPSG
jgi:diacylglycerol kinase family enzyme